LGGVSVVPESVSPTLRMRFGQQAKADPTLEPAPAGPLVSAVWDRELDG
jgi:hypothetical protein